MAINPANPIISGSATATNGSPTISVTGGVDCSFVTPGVVLQIGTNHLVAAISGTAPVSGTSTITLAANWAYATVTGELIAWNTIEGLAGLIQRQRDALAGQTAIGNLTGFGFIERTGTNAYTTATVTAAGKALLDDADATAQRTTLGLGTAATRTVGTASANIRDNTALDAYLLTRIGTAGNLGTAAQASTGSLAAQILTNEQRATVDLFFSRATVDLSFAKNEHRIYGAFGPELTALTTAVTTTRNSTATYQGPLVVGSAAINTPRITYDPVTGNNLGALGEEQRTNLLLHSQYTAASGETPPTGWTATEDSGTTTTASSGRFSGAIRLSATGTAQREVISQTLTLAAATTYTLSCYFAAGTVANDNVLRVTSADSATGTLVLAGSAVTGPGVYAITFTTASGGSYTISVGLGCSANATGTVIHETPQLEAGSYVTQYIPTTTAQATRVVDIISRAMSDNPQGTIVCLCSGSGPTTGVNKTMFALTDGTTNNRVLVRRNNSTGGTQYLVISGGTNVAQVNTTQKSAGQINAYGISWKTDKFLASEDGATVLNDVSGAVPAGLTQLNITSSIAGAESLGGSVKRIAYAPQALTEAELNAVVGWLKSQ